MTPKVEKNVERLIEKLRLAYAVNPSGVGAIVNDATVLANRLINRAPTEGMERIEYAPSKGPVYEFTGLVLHEGSYNDSSIEIAQTVSGKLVVFQEWRGSQGDMLSRIDVLEAGDYIGVMDALNWSGLARNAAKALKWRLRVEVE